MSLECYSSTHAQVILFALSLNQKCQFIFPANLLQLITGTGSCNQCIIILLLIGLYMPNLGWAYRDKEDNMTMNSS